MTEPQAVREIAQSLEPPSNGREAATPGPRAVVVAEAPGSLLKAIVEMAKDPSVNIPALKELMAMQERLEARQAEREFIAAFARLSADLPRVKKNGTIALVTREGKDKGSIPFARWEDVDKIVRPLMVREGFTLSFDSVVRPGEGGGLIVTATLMHRDGHTRTASMPLALDGGPGRNNLQAGGSTLSYGKRYTTEMLLNIVREGEDDDGKLGGTRFITAEQVDELRRYLKATSTDEAAFLQHFEVASVENLQVAAYAPARNMLLQKLDRQAKAKRGEQ